MREPAFANQPSRRPTAGRKATAGRRGHRNSSRARDVMSELSNVLVFHKQVMGVVAAWDAAVLLAVSSASVKVSVSN
jgi:hypothetical protein